MKAFISIKYREDNSNKDCIENISTALEQNGFETVCIARDIEKWGQLELRACLKSAFVGCAPRTSL